MCAKLPYSLLTRDRFETFRWFTSPRRERTHRDHKLPHALLSPALHREEASERSIHAGHDGRRRWLRASVQQLYAVSVAMATVVVLLWRGSPLVLGLAAFGVGLLLLAGVALVRRLAARRPLHRSDANR